jgi:hypothetical protein
MSLTAVAEGPHDRPVTTRRTARPDDTFQWPPPIDEEPDIIWLDGKGAPVIRQTPKAARKDPPPSAARRPPPPSTPGPDVRLASRRELLGDFDIYVPTSREPTADLNLRLPPRSSAGPGSLGRTGTMRPARRRSGTGFAVLVMILSACAAFAGEYVVRGMGTPDVGSLVATLNHALSSAVPFLPPLPSAALVSPLQSSLPSEQRLLESVPGEDKESQPDRKASDRKSKDEPAVAAAVRERNVAATVATPTRERRLARSARPVDVAAAHETPPAAPTARSTPPAPRPDEGILQASTQEQRGEIEDVLRRYELAYRRLDAGGAKAVWPALDERTLARSFDGLSWQEVRFDRCIIHLSSPDAEAVCAGVAAFAPKAGNREPRSERRRWTFQLKKTEGAWTIVRADAKQDDRP